MADLVTPQGLLALEEQLELEASSSAKHEYVHGMLYALASGSDRHNRIASNFYVALQTAARRSQCRAYMSGLRLLGGYRPISSARVRSAPCLVTLLPVARIYAGVRVHGSGIE